MIPYHAAHCMNGAIVVLPRDGFKDKYDKAICYGTPKRPSRKKL
jgi:hypothetical protein